MSELEFDFIVGADGKRNTLQGFRRKCFRAKQALAITFNLVNRKTRADTQVGGVNLKQLRSFHVQKCDLELWEAF